MFGMLTSVPAPGMFNPISLGAGLLMGRKAYHETWRTALHAGPQRGEDQSPQVHRRRSLRGHQGIRDRLKTVQRQLRDHYREIANQTRSLNESLAPRWRRPGEETERANRVRELERQANILRQGDRERRELPRPSGGQERSDQGSNPG